MCTAPGSKSVSKRQTFRQLCRLFSTSLLQLARYQWQKRHSLATCFFRPALADSGAPVTAIGGPRGKSRMQPIMAGRGFLSPSDKSGKILSSCRGTENFYG